jgi:hypothetical protein
MVNGLLGHIARFWRRVRVGPNPLARPWDRIEAALLITLVAGAALALPLAAFMGSSSYADTKATSARESLSRHLATATVLTDSPPPMAISEGSGALFDNSTVPAQRTLNSGAVRTGNITAPTGGHAGAKVPIWLNGNGDLVPAPLTPADATAVGILTGFLVWLGATALLVGLYLGGRSILDRRRAEQWDRDWANVAGQWTSY